MPTPSRVAINRDGILIDDKPLFLLAGQLHYFRWPRAEWRDLLVQVPGDHCVDGVETGGARLQQQVAPLGARPAEVMQLAG